MKNIEACNFGVALNDRKAKEIKERVIFEFGSPFFRTGIGTTVEFWRRRRWLRSPVPEVVPVSTRDLLTKIPSKLMCKLNRSFLKTILNHVPLGDISERAISFCLCAMNKSRTYPGCQSHSPLRVFNIVRPKKSRTIYICNLPRRCGCVCVLLLVEIFLFLVSLHYHYLYLEQISLELVELLILGPLYCTSNHYHVNTSFDKFKAFASLNMNEYNHTIYNYAKVKVIAFSREESCWCEYVFYPVKPEYEFKRDYASYAFKIVVLGCFFWLKLCYDYGILYSLSFECEICCYLLKVIVGFNFDAFVFLCISANCICRALKNCLWCLCMSTLFINVDRQFFSNRHFSICIHSCVMFYILLCIYEEPNITNNKHNLFQNHINNPLHRVNNNQCFFSFKGIRTVLAGQVNYELDTYIRIQLLPAVVANKEEGNSEYHVILFGIDLVWRLLGVVSPLNSCNGGMNFSFVNDQTSLISIYQTFASSFHNRVLCYDISP